MKQTQIKALAVALSMAMLPLVSQTAYAAGLGRLTVYSAMGQPLRAQLEITASKDELGTLTAQLASADAFRLAGIDYSGALAGLRFSKGIRDDGARKYIEVTTERPLNEPFVDMLVELNWSAGRLVREYTFLLDPPELATKEPPSSTSVAVPATQADLSVPVPKQSSAGVKSGGLAPPATSQESGSAPAASRVVEKRGSGASASLGQEREVRTGDTLGKIAREVRSEGVSLDQMLVALFRENPDAFDGNMNRMRAGRILRVPESAVVGTVDAVEARKEVLAQAGDFAAYRARVAARAVASPAKDAMSDQGSQGKLAPKVEEKTPAIKPGADKLAVSRNESQKDAAVDAKAKARVGALEEDLVARDRALKDANGRIADLEKNLNDLKKLAELKSQAGLAAQKAAEAPKPAELVKPPEPPKPAEPPKPVEAAKAPEPQKPTESAAAAKPGESVPTPSPEVKPAEDAPKPAPKPKKPVVIEEPEPEPDFMEENGPLVLGGGGVLALLLGYLGFAAYRRKKAAVVGEESAPMTEPSASVASVFSDTVSGSVAPATVDNLGQSSVLDTVAAGDAASIDPLDEADTYLAFGKDSQAEEILLDALKESPARWAIHLKLLEIYAARRGTVQFNTLAEDLRAQTGAAGPEWDRASEMGRSLDPNNALYSAQPDIPAAVRTPVSTTQDMAATMVFAAPPPVAPSPAPEAAPGLSVSEDSAAVLDFDLGLDEPEQVSTAEVAAPAAESAEVAALDFDLDLGDDSGSPKPVGPVAETASPVEVAAAPAALNIDFDLELPAAKSEPIAEAPAPLALNLELPETPSEDQSSSETLSLDSPLTLDVPRPEEAPAAASDVPDFDFDLGEAPSTSTATSEPSVTSVDIPLDAGENPEAATKLELAFAYEEMGDRDGARELFQEVLAEGSASQQAAAKARLEQLG